SGSSARSFILQGNALTGLDGGTTPITVFRSTINNSTVSTRPLFQWQNATTAMMTMDASGNVGIGTSSLSAKLHISGSSGGRSLILDGDGSSGLLIRKLADSDNSV